MDMQRKRYELFVIGTTLLIVAGALPALPSALGAEASRGITQKPEPLEVIIARTRSTALRQEPLEAADYDALIWQIRQIGLHKQYAHLKALIEALHPDVLKAVESTPATKRARFHLQAAALMAISRLGNLEGADSLKQRAPHLDPYFRTEFLPVIIARIRTESQLPTPRSSVEWQEKVAIFMKETGLLLSDAISALNAYQHTSKAWPPDNLMQPPRAVVALRLLVEMACEAHAHGVSDAFERLFELLGIPEKRLQEKDYLLWLRVQLGKRTTPERIEWLIERLLDDEIQTLEDRYLQQALVDCGEPVVPVLIAKIQQLEQGNLVSHHRVGLELLLEVLSTFDSPQTMRLLERIACRADNYISEAAEAFLSRIRRGEKPTFVSWF